MVMVGMELYCLDVKSGLKLSDALEPLSVIQIDGYLVKLDTPDTRNIIEFEIFTPSKMLNNLQSIASVYRNDFSQGRSSTA
jgi:hypothetical protein